MALVNLAAEFLKSRGFKTRVGEKFPFFDDRKQLHSELGLDSQLGEFRGTPEQDSALANSLRNAEQSVGVSMTPDNLRSIVRTSIRPQAPAIPQQQQAPEIPDENQLRALGIQPGTSAQDVQRIVQQKIQALQAPQPSVSAPQGQDVRRTEPPTVTDFDRQWYNIPQGFGYFVAPGRNGGMANNLISAPDNTVFEIEGNPSAAGLEGFPNTFIKRGRSLIPFFGDPNKYGGAQKVYSGQLGNSVFGELNKSIGFAPLDSAVREGTTPEQAEENIQAELQRKPEQAGRTSGQSSATGTLQVAGLGQTPAGGDISQQALERVTGSPTFPFEQQGAEAEREQIRLKAQADTESFLKNIASRGLIFSGIRSKGESTIEADKLSKLLGVDRKFSLMIVKGLEKATQDIAKEAQQGKKEAQEALNVLGYGINPATGRIEQTLQAKQFGFTQEKEAQAQQRFEATQEATQARFEATQALSEARLGIQMAQNQAQMEIAQRRLELAEENARRVGSGLTGLSTQLKQLELQQKLAEMIPSEGQIINKKTGIPMKVSDAFADSIASGKTMLTRDIPAIKDLVNKVDTGPVRAKAIRASSSIGTSTSEENQIMALIADLNSKLLNLRSGAAVTPQEYERLQPLLPRLENQPQRNVDNLDIFNENLEKAIKDKLDVRGLDIAGGLTQKKPDLNSFVKPAWGGTQ